MVAMAMVHLRCGDGSADSPASHDRRRARARNGLADPIGGRPEGLRNARTFVPRKNHDDALGACHG